MNRLAEFLALAQELDNGSDINVHPLFTLKNQAINFGLSTEEFDSALTAAVKEGHIVTVSDCGPRGEGYFTFNRTLPKLTQHMARALLDLLAAIDSNNDQHPDWIEAVCKAREAVPVATTDMLQAISVDQPRSDSPQHGTSTAFTPDYSEVAKPGSTI